MNQKLIIVRYLPGSCGKMLASYIYFLGNQILNKSLFNKKFTNADLFCEQNNYNNLSSIKYESRYSFPSIHFNGNNFDFSRIEFYPLKNNKSYYVIDLHQKNLDYFLESINIKNIKIITIKIDVEQCELIDKLFSIKQNAEHYGVATEVYNEYFEYEPPLPHLVIHFDDIISARIGEKENTQKLCEFLDIEFNEDYYKGAKKLLDLWSKENQSLL